MAKNGADVLILVRTSIGPDVYTAVGSQRNATIEEETAEIDASSKDSRAMRVLAGRYSGTVSLDALYVPSDAAFVALQTAFRDGDLVRIRTQDNGVADEQADALITSMSKEFPDQEEATISMDLRLDGEWTAVP